MEYKFKFEKMNGDSKSFPIKANTVGIYLENLQQRDGKINPKTVVEEARDENALLHKYFEWNNDIAAEKFRVNQAKQLIRCIVIVDNSNEGKQVETRAFVNVSFQEGEQKSYYSAPVVMQNDYARDLLLKQAEKDIETFQVKYHSLKELDEILSAMSNFKKAS